MRLLPDDTRSLYIWQQLRAAGLKPEERLEILCRDFFQPPLASGAEYEATLRNVSEAMQ